MKRLFFYALSLLLLISAASCKKEGGAADVTTVKDCEGNTYPVIKVGYQYWMAENLKCTKYDTESERPAATLSTSEVGVNDPYYTDGRSFKGEYSSNLSAEQRKKMGLLYNWAAAVGFATGEEAESQDEGFVGVRQGICPNGWHIPTATEWRTLAEYLGGVYIEKEDAYKGVGAMLRTTTGWYEPDGFVPGTDKVGFGLLPAGVAEGSSIMNVGYIGGFWTAVSDRSNMSSNARCVPVNDMLSILSDDKKYAKSVRCVKNLE